MKKYNFLIVYIFCLTINIGNIYSMYFCSEIRTKRVAIKTDSLLIEKASKILNVNKKYLTIVANETDSISALMKNNNIFIFQNLKTQSELLIEVDSLLNIVRIEKLDQSFEKLEKTKQAKLDSKILEALENACENTWIDIIIKLRTKEFQIDKSRSTKKVENDYHKFIAENIQKFKILTKKYKIRGGFKFSDSDPFITANLPISDLKKIIKWQIVEYIGVYNEEEILD